MSENIELVLRQYFRTFDINKIIINKIEFGICNQTYKVFYKDNIFILQKLNPIFCKDIISDIELISSRLSLRGWSVPKLVKNIAGESYTLDNRKRLWRLYRYIAGYTINDLAYSPDVFRVGETLARFHNDLSRINFIPSYYIPYFHDSTYFINKLNNIVLNFKNAKLKHFSRQVIKNFNKLDVSGVFYKQLIHGDPRLENFLFSNNGKPFCIIDFDTFIVDSIFIDLGDLLRSINTKGGETILNFSLDNIKKILQGYNSVAKLDKDYFYKNSFNTFKQIVLELCARFLIDVVEDRYFSWDKSNYKSRKDHNIARALCQWGIYKKINLLTHLDLL